MTRRLASLGLVLAACAAYSAVQLARIPVGATDIGTTAFAVWDEFLIGRSVHGMHLRGDWNYRIAVYPAFSPYLNRVVTGVAHVLWGADESVTVRALRTLSCILGIASAWLAYVLSLRWWPGRRWLAVSAAVLLLASPEILRWGGRTHPETLLTLEMLAATFALGQAARTQQRRWLYACAVFAGLATATKIVGVFMLPALCVVACLERGITRETLKRLASLVGVFLVSLVVFSPPALFSARTFWKGIAKQANENFTSTGHWWDWPLAGLTALGVTIAILSTLQLAVVLRAWIAQARTQGLRAALWNPSCERLSWALTLFVLTYGGYVLLTVKIVVPRYVLPLWPALAWLALSFVSEGKMWRKRAFGVLLLADLLLAARWVHVTLPEEAAQIANAPQLQAAPWLREHLPRAKAVIYDVGAYAPYSDTFHYTWGLLRSQAEKADVIIVHGPRRALYAKGCSTKPDCDRQATYAALEDNTLLDFVRVRSFPEAETTVYARQPLAEQLVQKP